MVAVVAVVTVVAVAAVVEVVVSPNEHFSLKPLHFSLQRLQLLLFHVAAVGLLRGSDHRKLLTGNRKLFSGEDGDDGVDDALMLV